MTSWLRGHGRLSNAAAKRIVRAGRVLEHLPAVAAGFTAGSINLEQVDVIAPVTEPARLAAAADAAIDLAAIDATFAEVAASRPHGELVAVVHRCLAWLDQDGPEPDPTEGRSLTIVKHADGSSSGRFELDAVGTERLQTAIEAIDQADRPAGDTRTKAQRQADAFVQLCDNQLAAGSLPQTRGKKPQIGVIVPLADLIDPSVGPATAEGGFGAILSAARARWIACDADITRIVLGPDGQPLDYGHRYRLVPPGLRTVVVQRDRTCVFAGCGAPHHWCDVHHLIHWILGGETSLENSGLLCERHHTQVHHGFTVERDTAGRWHTYRPDGTEILIPEPLMVAA
jgi:hypothetical protein